MIVHGFLFLADGSQLRFQFAGPRLPLVTAGLQPPTAVIRLLQRRFGLDAFILPSVAAPAKELQEHLESRLICRSIGCLKHPDSSTKHLGQKRKTNTNETKLTQITNPNLTQNRPRLISPGSA
jgi:hypothetical protein